ncbi:hypothetical protein HOD02_01215 [bacterium]|jgi:hypothetical protein|nr:hypothetical protein [bacterium]
MKKEKKEAFKRLAEHRTERAIHYIDLISNLSNKRSYDYDEKDVKVILAALNAAVRNTKARFDASTQKKKFTLDGLDNE